MRELIKMTVFGRFLQLSYVAMVAGGFALFASRAFMFIGPVERLITFVIVAMALLLFAAASFSDPGRITSHNFDAWSRVYPPDEVLYDNALASVPHARCHCDECSLKRVPRSRHCYACGACIARFDHHCVWLDNCVGAHNVRYFLGFLLMTTLVCAYAALLCWRLRRELREFGVGLGIFCAIMAVALAGFSAFHVYLASVNLTSYERARWARYHESGARARALAKEIRKCSLTATISEVLGGSASCVSSIERVLAAGDKYNEHATNAYCRATMLDNYFEIIYPMNDL